MGPSKPQIILFLLTLSIISTHADVTTFIYKGCANQKFQDPSGISSQNLQSLYSTLIPQSSTTNYHNATAGNDRLTTSITGLYQCRGDLSNSDCNKCVKTIPEMIEKQCGRDTIAARVQLDGCYLRYEVVGFPVALATEFLYKQCGSGRVSGSGFDSRVETALEEVEKGIGNGKGYYTGVYDSVDALAQCEGGLGSADCEKCVKSAAENARTACGSSVSGRVYLQQCYVSYMYSSDGVPGSGGGGVIQTGETETGGGGGRHNTQKTVAIVIGGLAGLFLGIAFLLVLRSAFRKKNEKHTSFEDVTTFIYKGCANQKFQDPSGISSQNLQTLYSTLIAQSSTTNYHNATAGNDRLTTSITGLYQCRGDLSNSDCNKCVKTIPEMIEKQCGRDTIAARVQLDGCYLRYEVVGFPVALATEFLYKQCGSGRVSGSGFDSRVETALEEVEKGIGNGKGYYTGVYDSVDVLAQCEGGLESAGCEKCVKSAAENARTACGSSVSGRVYLQQCYVSYTYYPDGVPGSGGDGVIQTGETETGGGGGRHNTQKTVAIVIGGLAGLFLGIAFLLVLRSAFRKKNEKHTSFKG